MLTHLYRGDAWRIALRFLHGGSESALQIRGVGRSRVEEGLPSCVGGQFDQFWFGVVTYQDGMYNDTFCT